MTRTSGVRMSFAIMPDCHAGAGCVIGLTMKIVDKVVPNLVGVDIGCGMLVVKIDKSFKFDLQKVDRIWHEYIPSGINHRTKKHKFADNAKIEDIIAPVNVDKLKFSIGTLGGGNHFGEIDVDNDGNYYIVIHSGSRHLGIEVCKHYQRLAIEYHRSLHAQALAPRRRVRLCQEHTAHENAYFVAEKAVVRHD